MKWKNVLYKIIFLPAILGGKLLMAQVPADSTAADSALLKQIEQQMQENTQPAQTTATNKFLTYFQS